jgi:thiol-disulfide isomerase/thioredoxin
MLRWFLLSLPFAANLLYGAVGPIQDCEPSEQTLQTLRQIDRSDSGAWLDIHKQQFALEEAMAKQPDNVFLHIRYRQLVRMKSEADMKAAIEKYKRLAEENPTSDEFQFLYAYFLIDRDTPQTITLLKRITSGGRGYPMAYLRLSDIYGYGKFADRTQARAQLVRYYEVCPASLDGKALSLLLDNSDPPVAAKYATVLRERLTHETAVDRQFAWETVWNLEFRAHPPEEHTAVRKQLKEDLDRLRQGPQGASLQMLPLLGHGYAMLGDAAAQRELEDQILDRFPNTLEAQSVVDTRWRKEHPYPKPEDTDEIRHAFYLAELEFADQQSKKYPSEFNYAQMKFDAVGNLSETPSGQLIEAAETLRKTGATAGVWAMPPFPFQIARAYLKKGILAEQVPALVEEGRKNYQSQPRWTSDRDPAELKTLEDGNDFYTDIEAANLVLDAAARLKKPQVAQDAIEKLAMVKTDKPAQQAVLWPLKAKWAELNGHKLDALLMYRMALDTRSREFRPFPGEKDEVSENYDRLWGELGGTAEASDLLLRKVKPVEAKAAGPWEKPTRDLPSWELPDLEGKTWRLASLHGKMLLINVWSTWCGACRLEHPYLEKLYAKLRARNDVQVLTFNIDEEIGLVEPYMKENKYTFPVLLAKDYVNDLLPAVSIPRNWIVDGNGKWEWENVGFSPSNWDEDILQRLAGENPQAAREP